MKKLALFVFIFLNCFGKDKKVPDDAFMIDTIGAVIFSQEGTEIITFSDVVRPSLTGMQQSQEDLLFERLVYLDATKFKIAPNEEALDKYLAEIQKQNNLTLDELKLIFKQAGYSYQEGREQFKRLQTVKSLLDYKINSNLIVPKQQIEKYYNEQPEKEEAEYKLEYGTMTFQEDREDQQKQLLSFAQNQKNNPGVVWNEPFWMKDSEISEDKQFICTLKKGEISCPCETGTCFELYHLLDKKEEKVRSLEERYDDIARTLTQPKYEKLMEDYKKQLFDSVSILYF